MGKPINLGSIQRASGTRKQSKKNKLILVDLCQMTIILVSGKLMFWERVAVLHYNIPSITRAEGPITIFGGKKNINFKSRILIVYQKNWELFELFEL